MMITNEQFKKRVSETKNDIFPLDRLLPLETVYSIFREEYIKTDDRNLFFRDRKFQRLREGYFTLFATIFLNETTKKRHLLFFPSTQDTDVYIAYPKGDKLNGYAFDVKEFTNWSDSFANFVDKSIIPKADIYNLIIATYRKIDGNDLACLIKRLNQKDILAKVWLIGAPREENNDKEIAKVTIVDKNGLVYDKTINLDDWIDKNKQTIIYQDVVRLVQPPFVKNQPPIFPPNARSEDATVGG